MEKNILRKAKNLDITNVSSKELINLMEKLGFRKLQENKNVINLGGRNYEKSNIISKNN